MTAALGNYTIASQEVIAGYLRSVHNGTAEGMAANRAALRSGTFLTDPDADVDKTKWTGMLHFVPAMIDASHSQLIPAAWRLDSLVRPVLIYHDIEGKENADNFKTPYDDFTAQRPEDMEIISDSDAAKSRFVLDGTVLFLLDVHTCEKKPPYITTYRDCLDGAVFRALPGIEKLDGNSGYGAVTRDAMIESSHQGFLNNHNTNGYSMADQTTLDKPYEQDLRTPGYFKFPNCRMMEAYWNWVEFFGRIGDACDNYPCCGFPE